MKITFKLHHFALLYVVNTYLRLQTRVVCRGIFFILNHTESESDLFLYFIMFKTNV